MLAQKVMGLAEEYCEGKIIFVLEGGYDPTNVANGAEAVFVAATGRAGLDVRDLSHHKEPEYGARIDEIRRWHGYG
jgi:acetoin utilization deacetylase AcuC-like enzyme